MKKRLLPILLCVCMIAACLPSASAADAVRETDFFTDQYHADVDFSSMAYEPVTREEIDKAVSALRALLTQAAPDAARVEAAFNAVTGLYQTAATNYELLTILTAIDIYDREAAARHEAAYTLYQYAYGRLASAVRDVLKSPCGGFLRAQLSSADISYYSGYAGAGDEASALSSRIFELQNSYYEAYGVEYTFEYGGVTYTDTSAREALKAGRLTKSEYDEIGLGIARARNAALGGIYMEELALNTRLAALYGYSSYGEYAYEVEYGRDYTFDEVLAYAAAVKKYIVPLSDAVEALYSSDVSAMSREDFYNFYYSGDYTQDETLDAIRPYIGRMSSELLESWDYMIGHHLYDITYSDKKSYQGFSYILEKYGAPFLFNQPDRFLGDFSTILHEFGHYNNYYWHPSGWNDGSCTIDVAETHSQGMELLFTRYYPNVLGENYNVAEDLLMYKLLYSAIINGAMLGELEIYAAATPNVTLRQINEKYRALAGEYGVVERDDPRTEMYDWITIPHLTTRPMYYISYSASAAGAFTFWLDAQEEGYQAATDEYLKFVAQDPSMSFQRQFRAAGMPSPLSPAFVAELAGRLAGALSVERRLAEDVFDGRYYSDVSYLKGDWFYGPVQMVAALDLMQGVSGERFDPAGPATRAMAATIMWRLGGEQEPSGPVFTDLAAGSWYEGPVNWAGENGVVKGYGNGAFGPNDTVTREQMAVILYNAYHLALGGKEPGELGFTDAGQVSPWAREAMKWCVANGIFQGSGGMLFPKKPISRAELATVMYNLCEAALGGVSAYGAGPDPSAALTGPLPIETPLVLR